MLPIESIADFWDCEIEHAEAKKSWVNEHLLYIISTRAGRWNLSKVEVESELAAMAMTQAVKTEWDIGDRILTFEDGSRMGAVAPGAGTMAGRSRVMEPSGRGVRDVIRGNRPYIHGSTRSAWHWTRNGKELGKPAPIYELTGIACPKTGLWVRRICERGCSAREVWAVRLDKGTSLPHCPECGSRVNFGWATP